MFKRILSNFLRIEGEIVNGLKDTIAKSPFDYVLGDGNIPIMFQRPSGDWTDSIPVYERQNRGFETYSCVLQSLTNCVEIYIKAFSGVEVNYSDRALAKQAGVSLARKGTSFPEGAQAARDIGFIPEEVYPFEGTKTFKEFYQPLPATIFDSGRIWKMQYEYSFQWVSTKQLTRAVIENALKIAPIQTSMRYIGQKNRAGHYEQTSTAINHCVVILKANDIQNTLKGENVTIENFVMAVRLSFITN